MYESPIKLNIGDVHKEIVKQQDKDLYRFIQKMSVDIDKDELIKALKFDREQYEKGYKDGVIEFVGYLKKHPCNYDLDNYHSFEAVDIEYLDDYVESFYEDKYL